MNASGRRPMPDRSPFWLADAVRPDFPILHRRVGDRPLSYLNSGNTSQ